VSDDNPPRAPVYRALCAPVYAQLELTTRCNARCIHCYNGWQFGGTRHSITPEQIQRCLAQFREHRLVQVVATGGEPLLVQDQLLFLVSGLTNADIGCSLNSNLILMNDGLANELKRRGLRSVLTSFVSSDRDTHGLVTGSRHTFEAIINGIRCILTAGIPLSVNIVATRHNWRQVYSTVGFLASLGVRSVNVTKGSPPLGVDSGYDDWRVDRASLLATLDDLIRARNDFGLEVDILECYPLCFFPNEPRYRAFTSHRCTAGVTTCTVGADGLVRPCSHADMTYGNVFDEDLSIIWARMDAWRRGTYLPMQCISCAQLTRCSGGCRMEAKFQGDIAGMDPWAEPHNALRLDSLSAPPPQGQVDLDEELRLADNVLLRTESFGWLVSVGPASTFLVTPEAGHLLFSLRQRQSFTVRELLEEYGASERMRFVLGRLRHSGILRRFAQSQ
jgi:AdoMet-dependent heme synthase